MAVFGFQFLEQNSRFDNQADPVTAIKISHMQIFIARLPGQPGCQIWNLVQKLESKNCDVIFSDRTTIDNIHTSFVRIFGAF